MPSRHIDIWLKNNAKNPSLLHRRTRHSGSDWSKVKSVTTHQLTGEIRHWTAVCSELKIEIVFNIFLEWCQMVSKEALGANGPPVTNQRRDRSQQLRVSKFHITFENFIKIAWPLTATGSDWLKLGSVTCNEAVTTIRFETDLENKQWPIWFKFGPLNGTAAPKKIQADHV